MMSQMGDDNPPTVEALEQRITRALDGELSDDEQAALDRELVSDPEARRLWDRTRELDELAGDTLRACFGSATASTDDVGRFANPRRRKPYHWSWWLMPGAVAAALLAVWMLMPGFALQRPQSSGQVEVPAAGARAPRLPVASADPSGLPSANGRSASSHWPARASYAVNRPRPVQVDRTVNRDIFGVRGSDGRIYLIEIDHTQLRQIPGGRWSIRPASGDY